MENPSLRVSGHGGSTNRTFIVEHYPEDEYGQWTTDEATGEQSRHVKKKKNGKGKGKGKGGFKRTGRAFLGEEQAQDPEWWSEEDSVWWSKEKRQESFFER